MRPNFKEVSLKELRDYILSHREDEQAFYIYIDRINAECKRVTHPQKEEQVAWP